MVNLPSFPRAMAQDDLVIIEYEDGKRYVWGSEGAPEKAMLVAEQLDVELKLMAYIREASGMFLNSIYESITSIADDQVVLELMYDALYQWIIDTKT